MDTPPAVGWLEKLIPAVWYGSLTVFVAVTAAFSILLYLTRPTAGSACCARS
ncbi:Uncharacterised protein [Chromobacterium violaceum]|uniref:Uncharacterized protein n=1 Tax=Chromobacterium violaceum TaxID=536 RepID=A0A3S4HIM8_CHRVL|nr:Uncharacterised protein [Chromobacterium violaceum]